MDTSRVDGVKAPLHNGTPRVTALAINDDVAKFAAGRIDDRDADDGPDAARTSHLSHWKIVDITTVAVEVSCTRAAHRR